MIGLLRGDPPFSIVMEYCAGGCVFGLLHEDRDFMPSWQQKLAICVDICSGMTYLHLHKPQIIHRDLKSPNLLLFRKVQSSSDVTFCKVGDFGFSRHIDGNAENSDGVGTASWMA